MEGGCQKFVKVIRNNLRVLREASRIPGRTDRSVLDRIIYYGAMDKTEES